MGHLAQHVPLCGRARILGFRSLELRRIRRASPEIRSGDGRSGATAFVGGHNVGDEYLGKDPKIGAWRDTHVKVRGPVVQCVQVPWLEDWNWAIGTHPELHWIPEPVQSPEAGLAFCLPSSPADRYETCTLFFLHAIHAAKRRVYIATPYFVPDEQFISALQLAALRGVDVRILVPAKADNMLVHLSGFTFLPELEKAGVQTWR